MRGLVATALVALALPAAAQAPDTGFPPPVALSVAQEECIAAGQAVLAYGYEPWQWACGAEELARIQEVERRIRADCTAAGLNTYPGGLEGWYCAAPTRDGGKTCRRASDCEGPCLATDSGAAIGQCGMLSAFVGCQAILLDDGTRAELCVD
jgi:hypothetical protein